MILPELEDFLIANREEYLSYSARNYTMEQKEYNNNLTARVLELAEASGHTDLCDTQLYTFSTVRDKIRCYYKSYVQSSKRRGDGSPLDLYHERYRGGTEAPTPQAAPYASCGQVPQAEQAISPNKQQLLKAGVY